MRIINLIKTFYSYHFTEENDSNNNVNRNHFFSKFNNTRNKYKTKKRRENNDVKINIRNTGVNDTTTTTTAINKNIKNVHGNRYDDDDENDDDDDDDDNSTTEHFSILDPALFKPHIINALPKTYSSVIGAQAKFTCLTTVLFPVDCQWYLNGKLIDTFRSNGRIYTTNNNKTLVILSLREEDHGQLVMVAKNPFGKEKTKCRLSIYEDLSDQDDMVEPKEIISKKDSGIELEDSSIITITNKDSETQDNKMFHPNRLQNKSTKLFQDSNVLLSRSY